MDNLNLKDINKKLDELIQAYQRVKDENLRLKTEAESWVHERQRLLQQNELARNERFSALKADTFVNAKVHDLQLEKAWQLLEK